MVRVVLLLKTQHGYQFEYIIELHVDDLPVLNYLQTKFNMGKVYQHSNSAAWKVNRQAEVEKIISIFSENPLNTTKRLDFEDWKRSFELYINRDNNAGNNPNYKLDVFSLIDEIKKGMNLIRYIEVSNLDKIVITKYWLLGFIEEREIFQRSPSL